MNLAETIPALNRARAEGLAKNIGVSNFTVKLMADASVALRGAADQQTRSSITRFSPRPRCSTAARGHGMSVTAYCPIARGEVLGDPVLKGIAEAHGANETQIALAWLVAQGVIAIPRSSKIDRIMENFTAQDITLSSDEMTQIHALAKSDGRLVRLEGFAPDWD